MSGFTNDEVSICEGMAVSALGASRMSRSRSFASHDVDKIGHRLKMSRIDTGSISAQMIQRQAIRSSRNRSNVWAMMSFCLSLVLAASIWCHNNTAH